MMEFIEDTEILADFKAYDKVKGKKEENFPSDIVDKIFIQEENPIKVYREYRNLTQLELANKANLSINKIQEIEADIELAGKEELEAIVKNLNIDLDMITKIIMIDTKD